MISYSQARIWLLQTLFIDKPLYNISFKLNLTGNLNIRLFNLSINFLLKRAEILRSNIINLEGKPKIIFNSHDFKLEILNKNYNEATEYVKTFINKPFLLDKELLLRILKLNDKIVFSFSDLVIDGFSIINFFKELEYIYNSFNNDSLPQFSYKQLYYKYIYNLNNTTQSNSITYWKNKLIKKNCMVKFPISINNSEDKYSTQEDRIKFILNSDKFTKINNFCKNNSITIFNFFLSIIYVLIFKYTNDDFICLDTIKGTTKDTNNMIGLLNNTLLLPLMFNKKLSLNEYLNKIKINFLSILKNGDLLLEKIVNEEELESLPNIRIHFEYFNKNLRKKIKLGNKEISTDFLENSINTIRQLLMFNFAITNDEIDCFISYKKRCFNFDNILELKNNFIKIIDLYFENKSLEFILDNLNIKTKFNDVFIVKKDLRLLAYKYAGNYPNINFNEFKKLSKLI